MDKFRKALDETKADDALKQRITAAVLAQPVARRQPVLRWALPACACLLLAVSAWLLLPQMQSKDATSLEISGYGQTDCAPEASFDAPSWAGEPTLAATDAPMDLNKGTVGVDDYASFYDSIDPPANRTGAGTPLPTTEPAEPAATPIAPVAQPTATSTPNEAPPASEPPAVLPDLDGFHGIVADAFAIVYIDSLNADGTATGALQRPISGATLPNSFSLSATGLQAGRLYILPLRRAGDDGSRWTVLAEDKALFEIDAGGNLVVHSTLPEFTAYDGQPYQTLTDALHG